MNTCATSAVSNRSSNKKNDAWAWGTGKPKGETITVGGKEHVIVSAKAKGSAKGKPGAKARARKAYIHQKRTLRALKSAEKLQAKLLKNCDESSEARIAISIDMLALSERFARLSAAVDLCNVDAKLAAMSNQCSSQHVAVERGKQPIKRQHHEQLQQEKQHCEEEEEEVIQHSNGCSCRGQTTALAEAQQQHQHQQHKQQEQQHQQQQQQQQRQQQQHQEEEQQQQQKLQKHPEEREEEEEEEEEDSNLPLMTTDPLNKYGRKRVAELARAHGLLAEEGRGKHGMKSAKQQQCLFVFVGNSAQRAQAKKNSSGVQRVLDQWDSYVKGKGNLTVIEQGQVRKARAAERRSRERLTVEKSMKTIRAKNKRGAKLWLDTGSDCDDNEYCRVSTAGPAAAATAAAAPACSSAACFVASFVASGSATSSSSDAGSPVVTSSSCAAASSSDVSSNLATSFAGPGSVSASSSTATPSASSFIVASSTPASSFVVADSPCADYPAIVDKGESENSKDETRGLSSSFAATSFPASSFRASFSAANPASDITNNENDNESEKEEDGAGGLSPAVPWSAHTTGFGMKMLAKLGWAEGEGLGKEGDGIATPLRAFRNSGRGGLGS